MPKYVDPRATAKLPEDLKAGDRVLMEGGGDLVAQSDAYPLGEDRFGVNTAHQMLQFPAGAQVWVIPKK